MAVLHSKHIFFRSKGDAWTLGTIEVYNKLIYSRLAPRKLFAMVIEQNDDLSRRLSLALQMCTLNSWC